MFRIVLMCLVISLSDANKKLLSDNLENVNIDITELWGRFPLNLMKNGTQISQKCRVAYDHYLEGLNNFNLDDLKMWDSTGKLPSGILSGNINQFGDFDECMGLKNGKYCLADIDIKPAMKGVFASYKGYVHSFFPIKDTLNDSNHRTPGFSMIKWGFCIPKDCSNVDLEKSLQEHLGFEAKVKSNMCQVGSPIKSKASIGLQITRWYFAILLVLVVTASIMHSKLQNSKNIFSKILFCFAFQRNFESLTTVKDEKEEFSSIHGFRALSAIALLGTHKSMALLFNPYINRVKLAENISMGWSVIGRTAIVYTENFFVMSGLLNANALFRDLQKKNSIGFVDKIINRIFRILPSVLSVILFYTYILPFLGSGPQWPLVVDYHSELCKKYMWRNIFFIHNWFGFRKMCLTHTHQIGMDMQLFLVTPIFALLLWKNRKIGVWVTSACILISTIFRFWANYVYNLSYVVYYGISVSQLFDVATLSYILPTHRATNYLLGVLLAYALKTINLKSEVTKRQMLLFWSIFGSVILLNWFGPYYMSYMSFKYNNLEAALYAAFGPLTWGLVGVVFVYLTEKNYGGWFADIFRWKHWKYFTKIAYSLYLVQFPVYFYNVGKRRNADEYNPSIIFYIPEVLTILILSCLLTLFVEMPFQNLHKVLFQKDKIHIEAKGMNKTIQNKTERLKQG